MTPSLEAAMGGPVMKVAGKNSKEQSRAHAALSPKVQTAITLSLLGKRTVGNLDATCLLSALEEQVKASLSEETLASQATTLNSLFHALTQQAVNYIREQPPTAQVYLRLAMKAQAQCMRTLEVLNEMKSPGPVFINQANVAAQQIVQNGVLNVDSRAQSEAVGGHQTLAALGSLHRASNGCRQTKVPS